MNSISSIAVSGMAVAQQRLAVAAHNIANAGTAGFQRQMVESHSTAGGGANAVVVDAGAPGPGLFVEDAVELLAARQAFIANALVLRSEDRRIGSLLDILA